MWVALVVTVLVVVVSYILYTLRHTSGSELSGNSLDDFITEKDVDPSSSQTSKIKYYDKFSDSCGVQVRIVYGTEYGASEHHAKSLYKKVTESNRQQALWHPRMINCKNYQQLDWKQEELVLFIISTSGDGVPPTDAREFIGFLEAHTSSFSHIHYSVLALGDTNYPHYCKTGRQLEQSLQKLGARRIVQRHDVDVENQETIDMWISQVIRALSGVEVNASKDYLPQVLHNDESMFNRNNPFMAQITNKRVLTISHDPEDRETVHVEFDLTGSGLIWTSGDALGIYPINNPSVVRTILRKLSLTGEETVSVDNSRCSGESMTLYHALQTYYNLKDIPSDLFKYTLSHFQEEIKGISLKSLEVQDVLSYCSGIKAQELLYLLKPLQPRYYSISSSPAVNADMAAVTVAAVRYRLLNIERTGVCSTHLFDRSQVGDSLGVFISHNLDFRLPADDSQDVLMIGPGTGLAPFMAFISEREQRKAQGKMALYFGCRHQDKDFIYRKQLEKWSDDEVIELHCVFSRETADKVYVQHLMLNNGKNIYSLIQSGGHIYVCGDAARMAHDVHSALVTICSIEGSMSENEADIFLNSLTMVHRYQKDVWVA